MVKELQYTNIRRVLDNLLEHPMLKDITLEQVVRYTIRFIGLFSYPKMYCDKIDTVEIKDFRGLLPCDLISIIQVKDVGSGVCLRAMTDNFTPGMRDRDTAWHREEKPDLLNNVKGKAFHHSGPGLPPEELYIPQRRAFLDEPAFKTQGRVIFTSFPDGKVTVAYKAIAIDEDGFPLLLDNENYLAALEAYIKMKVFGIKFDQGKLVENNPKLAISVFQNAKQEYAIAAAALDTEFCTPSVSEAEALSRWHLNMLPKMREFDNGFKNLGDREYLRRH